MTLYLKYRPQAFADVVGQDHVVTTLENALKQGQLSHAYLLSGTRGTGKTSVARILAKTILTANIEDDVLRGQIVKSVEDGSLVDLIEIDAASNRRIDDVRELIERINFSPVVAKAKVYIIDEVHMLTKEAFNALLKTLEEPPPYAYFILATTELHKVPDTIQSRCQRFIFRRVHEDDLIRRMQFIADTEHITIDRDALRAIAQHATGSFRDAISLLDQLRSLEKITMTEVGERIGKTGDAFISDILQAINDKDVAALPVIVRKLEDSNAPLDQILGDLLTIIRSQMHESIASGENPARYLVLMDTLLHALKDLRISPVPGLVLESALLALASAGTEDQAPAPRKAKHMQEPAPLRAPAPAVTESAPKKTEPAAAPAPEKKEAKPAIIQADDLTVQTVLSHWPEIVKLSSPAAVRMSIKDASVTKIENGMITLAFPSVFHRDRVSETNARRSVEDALQQIFKRPVRIECVLEKDARSATGGPATDLVEAAGEVFGNI
jgi:DNA polymerase III subunit gamma/tau